MEEMLIPKALIITGDGLNCERETAYAYSLAGAEPEIFHISDVLSGEVLINKYDILTFIGGFSNGDHLGAATVQAARFRNALNKEINDFIVSEKPVIGICNGFQTLVKLGILPGIENEHSNRLCALLTNDSACFEDRWVNLSGNTASNCIWTKDIDNIFLPVRHGEGKFYAESDTISKLERNNQIVFKYSDDSGNIASEYPDNPNGSIGSIAGICDQSGLIFGLMPHPEAYLHGVNHPYWTRLKTEGKSIQENGEGLKIFVNAVNYCKNK